MEEVEEEEEEEESNWKNTAGFSARYGLNLSIT
jgi:hypothetical protein